MGVRRHYRALNLGRRVAIRTLVVRPGETSVTAGAGIVADSDPFSEERETENKAAAMLQAVGLAEALQERGGDA